MLSLERYRMLDLSRTLPGTFASHVLADLGMDVIRIEETEPRYGMGRDPLSPANPTPELEEEWAAYNGLARSKRSLALDLLDPTKRPMAQEVFYRLVKQADVVVEGYRPGAVQWMGVDYETVKQHNPRIVYCSLSGYGQTGPYARRPAHGGQTDGLSGTIRFEDGRPIGNPVPIGDISAALYATTCITSALLHREHTAEGQYIDIGLAQAGMSALVRAAANYAREGDPGQNQQPPQGPGFGFLLCKDGKWISTGNAETIFWENFCNVLGRPDWIPLRRTTGHERDQMAKDIREIFLTKTRDEWMRILVEAETCVGPVNNTADAFHDPQILHFGMVVEMEHPKFGTIQQMGFPARLSSGPVKPRSFAPLLGEHTEAVLEELGFEPAEIAELERTGIVKAWTPS